MTGRAPGGMTIGMTAPMAAATVSGERRTRRRQSQDRDRGRCRRGDFVHQELSFGLAPGRGNG
jgi:hypothetical protein